MKISIETENCDQQQFFLIEEAADSVIKIHLEIPTIETRYYKALYSLLTKKGYNVSAVQNPLTSLEDDVAATKVILDKQDGTKIKEAKGSHVIYMSQPEKVAEVIIEAASLN
jgi:hypothetical protein